VTSSTVGGDDGAFYFPYILDPQSLTAMLVGTCRVWRGPRAGGAYTVLSPNFDTLGSGTCSGSEVNLVQAVAAGGPTDQNGSSVIYATTSALGPLDGPLSSPSGGNVWVTTDASAGVPAFTNVTGNGPQGSNINPNQFPISGVSIDSSDPTGNTAYATVMGFTGGPGHVWKTTNAGGAWTDFTANLPDSPANAVVVYPGMSQVYVATDVGVFGSSTSAAGWTEVGPSSGPGQTGFLPNVAVTALGVFNSGGQQLLRASTYGRGVWQYNLVLAPDFEMSISNSPLTVSEGQNAVFNGSVTALNGYSSTVTLSCTVFVPPLPGTCIPAPSPLTPGISTPFTVTASGAVGDYYFNVQGTGSDVNNTTQDVSAVLHVLSNSPDFALSEPTSFPTVNAGSTAGSGPISVTAASGFTGHVTLTCSLISGSGSCSVNPSTVTSFPTTASVIVNTTSLSAGSYQLLVQGASSTTNHTLLIPFNVGDYQLSGTQALTLTPGAQGAATLTFTPSTYYSGNINATCVASSLPGATCSLNPGNPIIVNLGSTESLVATINVPSTAAPGAYNVSINTQDTTGAPSHNLTLTLTVQDFLITSSTASQTVAASQTTGSYNLTVQPAGASFNGAVNLSCPTGLPVGAQCLFSPSTPVTPGSTSAAVVMTISTSASTSAGTYPVTVTGTFTGTSGSLAHSVTVSLIVTSSVVSPEFQLAVTQAFPANLDAGSQSTAKVSVTPNYTGSVNVTCDASAISAAQCTVLPANPVAISANAAVPLTVSLNLSNTALPAAYNISLTVADSSGQPTQTVQLPLTVITDFSVSSATSTQTVTAGQTSGAYQLAVAPNPQGSSFAAAVTLACTAGLPAQAQCIFDPSTPLIPGASTVDVVMNISTTDSSAAMRPWTTWGTSDRAGARARSGTRTRTSSAAILCSPWLLLPGIVIGCGVAGTRRSARRRQRRLSWMIMVGMSLFLSLSLPSCGGVSNGGGGGTTGVPVTYTVTITGTSGVLSHSTQVTLVVD
jgi:hypothetical protein